MVSWTMVPSTSSAPKRSAICATSGVMLTQYALMCGTLSRRRRDTATVRSASMAVGAGRFFMPLPSGWKASGMNACRPLGLVLQRAQAEQVIDAVLEGLDVPVEHRRVRAHAERVRHAVHLEVLVGRRLVVRDARAHLGVEDLGAAAGQAVEPRARGGARAPRGGSSRSAAAKKWISTAVKHFMCMSGLMRLKPARSSS